MPLNSVFRIEIQDKVRRLGTAPDEDEVDTIEQLRSTMGMFMTTLWELQAAAGIASINIPISSTSEEECHFDSLVEEPEEGAPSSDVPAVPRSANALHVAADPLPIERQSIPFPSNGRIPNAFRDLEISARMRVADQQLARLRDLIADISFQYSHVIRAAPRKSLRLRGLAKVRMLNIQIVQHARIYSCCQVAFTQLNCGENIRSRYPPLRKNDLRASTAILNPNIPGASTLKLSWIWYTGERRAIVATNPPLGMHNEAMLLECEVHLTISV